MQSCPTLKPHGFSYQDDLHNQIASRSLYYKKKSTELVISWVRHLIVSYRLKIFVRWFPENTEVKAMIFFPPKWGEITERKLEVKIAVGKRNELISMPWCHVCHEDMNLKRFMDQKISAGIHSQTCTYVFTLDSKKKMSGPRCLRANKNRY
jgi:hypothetical protein